MSESGFANKHPGTEEDTLSLVIIPLLKGVVYKEDSPDIWAGMIRLQVRLQEYLGVLGLDLFLDEAEGYAFLRAKPEDDSAPVKRPRLIARRPLSFPVSLLLALLRRKLAEFDAHGGDTRLVLSRDEIVELFRVFLPEDSNEARLVDRVDAHLNKIVDLGFLRIVSKQERLFEVQRILKAFVDAQWLSEFDERLEAYRSCMNAPQGDDDE